MAKTSQAAQRDRLIMLLGQGVAAHDSTPPLALIPIVRRGLKYSSLRLVARFLHASIEEMAGSLQIARRTLDRKKHEGRLDPRISEKIVRIARVAARAEDVLGGEDEMRRWLRAPNQALGMVSPMSMLDTGLGAEAVLDVLGRLEHGVFS